MKKKSALLCLLSVLVLLLCACGKTSGIPTVIDMKEYTLYMNVFGNNQGPDYEGQTQKKHGIFVHIEDMYSNRTRYYVWGNLDNTLCCDWQWELKIDDPSSLPADGSVVDATGVFTADENALDGYWLTDVKIKTVNAYETEVTGVDVDMTTMSGTLERVQLQNVLYAQDFFEGKTILVYCRIKDTENIQDPYYDGSWYTSFTTSQTIPAPGTSVLVRGVMHGGVITDAQITTR